MGSFLRANWKITVVLLVALAAIALLATVAPATAPAGDVPDSPAARAELAITLPADDTVSEHILRALFPASAESESTEPLAPKTVRQLEIRTHVVRPGETISEIAQAHGVSIGTIISFNGVADVKRILAGGKLEIPNADGVRYRVQRGDTLIALSRRYGVQLNDVLDWNDLQSETIRVGETLFLPGARMQKEQLDRILRNEFIYPTRGNVTSGFGMRPSPFGGVSMFHNGIDISNRIGTPVVAAMTGRVIEVGYSPTYGWYVSLSHGRGYQTLYGHLDTVLVSRNQQVSQGQRIATMGNSGYSTGPHLHFSIYERGRPVDPLAHLQ